MSLGWIRGFRVGLDTQRMVSLTYNMWMTPLHSVMLRKDIQGWGKTFKVPKGDALTFLGCFKIEGLYSEKLSVPCQLNLGCQVGNLLTTYLGMPLGWLCITSIRLTLYGIALLIGLRRVWQYEKCNIYSLQVEWLRLIVYVMHSLPIWCHCFQS